MLALLIAVIVLGSFLASQKSNPEICTTKACIAAGTYTYSNQIFVYYIFIHFNFLSKYDSGEYRQYSRSM